MKKQTNANFPQNLCLELYTSLHTPNIPSEQDVLSAIDLIPDTINRKILLMVFQDGKTLKEIGQKLTLSKERVRQRKNLALWSIRRVLFPSPKREDPNDKPILPDTHPLRKSQEPFEDVISLTDSKTRILHECGYSTIADICRSSRNDLFKLRGFGYHSADTIIKTIRTLVGKGNTNYEQ